MAIALLTSAFITSHYKKIAISSTMTRTYSAAWHGFKQRLREKDGLKNNFLLANQFLQQQKGLPELQGTTDIYSYGQTYLLTNQYKWSPRPIFQSYSVFTAKLADLNQKHLLSDKSPENILFRIEPIDRRLPSLEDGASWPVLFNNYRPSALLNDFLVLKRKSFNTPPTRHYREEKHALGETVFLPKMSDSIFVKIAIEPTFWGKLAILFYKPSQLRVIILLKNGEQRQFRFSANMAKSGFLLSPLIENTEEFAWYYEKNYRLANKEVVAFRLETVNKNWEWHHEFGYQALTLSHLLL